MFPYWHVILWGAWAVAVLVLAGTAWRRRERIRAAIFARRRLA
jgi:hypothetical protein